MFCVSKYSNFELVSLFILFSHFVNYYVALYGEFVLTYCLAICYSSSIFQLFFHSQSIVMPSFIVQQFGTAIVICSAILLECSNGSRYLPLCCIV